MRIFGEDITTAAREAAAKKKQQQEQGEATLEADVQIDTPEDLEDRGAEAPEQAGVAGTPDEAL